MPEDLKDKMIDFELMLEGVFACEVPQEEYKTRVLEYWYSMSNEIGEKLNEEV